MNDTKQTRDGFTMTADVWEIHAGWTWGFIPETGSKYSAVARGVWKTKQEAEQAMSKAIASTPDALGTGSKWETGALKIHTKSANDSAVVDLMDETGLLIGTLLDTHVEPIVSAVNNIDRLTQERDALLEACKAVVFAFVQAGSVYGKTPPLTGGIVEAGIQCRAAIALCEKGGK